MEATRAESTGLANAAARIRPNAKRKSKFKAQNGKGAGLKAVRPLVNHEEGTKWYDYSDKEVASVVPSADEVDRADTKGDQLLHRDTEFFAQSRQKTLGSEAAWLSTVLVKGTAVDRASAVQLLVHSSPVHALAHVASLVTVAQRRNPRDALSVIGTLKELFVDEFLPPSRKLIPLSKRPLERLTEPSKMSDKQLLLWKFESDLKVLYEKFVDAIEKLASGNIENVCVQACRVALDLLIQRPELENKLLSLLVNKLGHPSNKLASRVCAYLVELTQRHAAMRAVVVAEVERLVYRRNVSCKAQLHAVSFLSQMRLRAGEGELAATLLNIYFGLFRMFVAQGKMDDKILTILLSATNRAFPYAKDQSEKLMKEVDTLYKLLHQSNFSTALQTLKLLYQLLAAGEGISDRYYAALYRKLLDSPHRGSVESQLLALVLRTLKADSNDRRVIAFIKRLLQLCLCRSAAFAAACLLLVSRVVAERSSLLPVDKPASKILKPESLAVKLESVEEDDDERYFDVPFHDDDDAETFTGAIKVEAEEPKPEVLSDGQPNGSDVKTGGWLHRNNIVVRSESAVYDPSARNPQFARADLSVAAELLLLRDHFHPSVAIFAANLLEGIPNRYDGDPLADFTGIRFLDRFVYRNPKKRSKEGEGALKNTARRKAYEPCGVKKLAVTSKEYLKKKENEIPADERFLHRFAVAKLKIKEEKEEAEDFDDIGSVNSEEFDQLLEHFEPGEKNDVFDVDFAKEFGVEKDRRDQKGKTRRADHIDDDEESGEASDEDGDLDVDNEAVDDEADEEDAEELDDEDGEDEDDDEASDDDGEREGSANLRGRRQGDLYDDDSDEDFAQQLGFAQDAAISADKLAEMMEDEADTEERSRRSLKRKLKKPRGFKKRRIR